MNQKIKAPFKISCESGLWQSKTGSVAKLNL